MRPLRCVIGTTMVLVGGMAHVRQAAMEPLP